MITWDLDKQNNLLLSHEQIKMAQDIEALRRLIDCELQIVKGELEYSERGVDYFGIVMANTPIAIKVQEIVRVITSVTDVESVIFNDARYDANTGTLHFEFTIKSVYGDFEYDREFAIVE